MNEAGGRDISADATPCPAALRPGLSAVLPAMSPKIIPCISRAISAQDEANGLHPSASGVANPEKADYSAAAPSPVSP